jgi:PAS domain S-box-containing protein
MFTESGDEEVAVQGMKAGLSDYVLKRHMERLPVAVHESLEKVRLESELAQAREQLQRSEARYRLISELTSDYAYAAHVEPDDRIVYEWITDVFNRITGYTLEELETWEAPAEVATDLVPDGWASIVHPEDRELAHKRRQRLLRGEPDVSEFRILTRAGETRWFRHRGRPVWDEEEGRVVQILGAAEDITEQVRMRAALQQAHEELEERVEARTAEVEELAETLQKERDVLRTIMEHTYAHLAYLDPDFNFVSVNAAYAAGTGFEPEELVGRNHFALFPDEENQRIFEQVRETGQPVRFEAKPFSNPQRPELGTTFWDWTLVPVRGEEGQLQGLVLSLLDVTVKVKAREERERRLAHLEQLVEISERVLAETTVDGVLACAAQGARELTNAGIGAAGVGCQDGAFGFAALSKSQGAQSQGAQSQGAQSQGAQSQGAQSQGAQSQGAQSQGAQSQGAQSQGTPEQLSESAWARRGCAYLAWMQEHDLRRLTHDALPEALESSLLGVRLVGGRTLAEGLLLVASKEEREDTDSSDFGAEDEALLNELATLTTLALRHLVVRQEAERRAEKLDAVFKAITDSVVVYDAASVPVEANPAAVAVLGIDPTGGDRAALAQALSMRGPDGQPYDRENFPSARAARGEPVVNERLVFVGSEGEQRVALASAAPLYAGAEIIGVVSTLHDITQQEQLLRDNRAQRDFLERLIEAAPVGIAVVAGPEYRYELVNPHYASFAGASDGAQLVGRTLDEVFPAVAERVAADLLTPARELNQRMSLIEYEATLRNGSQPNFWNAEAVPLPLLDGAKGRSTRDPGDPIDTIDSTDRVLVIVYEVTEQVLARQRAEELAARDQAILTSMAEGVILFDLEGNVLDMNPAALRLYRFQAVEEAQRPLKAYSPHFELYDLEGKPLPTHEWPLARALRGETFAGLEVRVCNREAEDEWYGSYGGTLVRDEHGRPILGVLTVRDVTARRTAEKEQEQLLAQLVEERARLDAVIESAPEGIVVADREVKIVRTNQVADRLYGRPVPFGEPYTSHAELQLCYPDGTPYEPRDLPLTRSVLDGVTVQEEEMAILWPDGQRRDILVNSAPIRGRDGRMEGAVAVFQDITDRKRTQEALRHYMARLQLLHDLDQVILAGASAKEVARATVERLWQLVPGVRLSVSSIDYEREEIVLLAVQATGPTRLQAGQRIPLAARPEFVAQLRHGQVKLETNIRTLFPAPSLEQVFAEGVRDYVHFPLIVQDELMGGLHLGVKSAGDVTEEQLNIIQEVADQLAIGLLQAELAGQVRQHTEELEQLVAARTADLQRSEARFRSVFEDAAMGITLVDQAARMLATNPALQRMLGWSAEELRGRTVYEITHPADRASSQALYQEFLSGACDRYRVEKRYLRKDGEPVWANLTVSRVQSSAHDQIVAIGMIEDVTEQKRAMAALIESEKLAVTGRLAASLAHEVNNPLQAIRSNLELVIDFDLDEAENEQYLNVCRLEIDRLSQLTQRVLGFARPRVETPQPVTVAELVERTMGLVGTQLSDNKIAVKENLEADLPPVVVGAGQIVQVLLNIILNAVDVLPQGGQVEIGARSEGKYVLLSLANDGPSIPVEDLERIFEPFFTTKPHGTGLGLAVSQRIIARNRGKLWVENREGEQGVRFTLLLPITQEVDETLLLEGEG